MSRLPAPAPKERARPASFNVAAVAQGAQAVPASDSRVSLTFYPSALGTGTYSTDPLTGNGMGWTVPQAGQPFTLTLKDHGAIVRMAWLFWGNPGNTPAVWSEMMD